MFANLPFILKLIERAVVKQLVNHLVANHLSEKFQLAYRLFHSTETALMSVLNDLLMAFNQKQSVFLVLLELSADLDTVDHSILLKQLETMIRLRALILDWRSPYLSSRHQHMSVAGSKSSSIELKHTVPQGSVLGPVLFSVYMLPLGDIFRKYHMSFHLYADDIQLYLSFDSWVPSTSDNAIIQPESCIAEIKAWMLSNRLKLNGDKTLSPPNVSILAQLYILDWTVSLWVNMPRIWE